MERQERLRQAKARLVARGLGGSVDDHPVSPAIERSWRRSISYGLGTQVAPWERTVDVETTSVLLAAARPVIRRLADDLADLGVAVVLSDDRGRIVERIASDRRQERVLDSAGAVIGADFSESAIGTNGLGSVIEERTALFVTGAEHFSERLESLACAGVPIADPTTRRLRGTLSLSSAASAANPLMLSMTQNAVRQIEDRLRADRSVALHDLAAAFDRASAAHRGPLALLTPHEVLANTTGLAYVTPANHVTLWNRLVRDDVDQPHSFRIALDTGEIDVTAQRVLVADEPLAFQVCIAETRDAPAAPVVTPSRQGLHLVPEVDERLREAGSRPVVALLGAAGAGKMHVARRLVGGQATTLFDAAVQPTSDWLVAARDALDSGEAVVVQHLDQLDADLIGQMQALALRAAALPASDHPWLVATAEPDHLSDAARTLIGRSAFVVEIPDVEGMRAQLPTLIAAMLAELSPGSDSRISAAAMSLLAEVDWPGNLAELEHTLTEALERRPAGVIGPDDLPASVTARLTSRRLSGLERSERTAIIAALRHHGGNRSAAADALGIGRTTLYRKMKSLKIDPGSSLA